MTLTQGHGCDIDKQKFACLQDKVRTTQPITTKLGKYIPLVMVIIWLDFGGILLEILFLPNFLRKFRMCFFKVKHYWTYLRNGWSDWCETKRRCIGWILGKSCDLDLSPDLWQGSIWGLAFWSPWDSMGPQKWSPLATMWSPKLEANNPCYFQDVLSQWSDNVIKHINICFYCIMFYHNSKCI